MADHGEQADRNLFTPVKVYMNALQRNGRDGKVRFTRIPNRGYNNGRPCPRFDDLSSEIRKVFEVPETDYLQLAWRDAEVVKFNTDSELIEAIPRMEKEGESLIIYAETSRSIYCKMKKPFVWIGATAAVVVGFVATLAVIVFLKK